MTYQHCRHEFSGGPGEAIERPWHSKGAVGVEGLLMFCHDPLNAGVPGDMAHQDLLVIHQVLSHALIGPVVGKILKGDSIRPIIWKWESGWAAGHDLPGSHLHEFQQIGSGKLDFGRATTKSSQSGLHHLVHSSHAASRGPSTLAKLGGLQARPPAAGEHIAFLNQFQELLAEFEIKNP